MSPKRVLLTGAAGAVGAVLTHRLLARGDEVHVVLKRSSQSWRLAAVQADLRIHYMDLTDEEAVAALVAATRPDIIYHLATHGAYPFRPMPTRSSRPTSSAVEFPITAQRVDYQPSSPAALRVRLQRLRDARE
jgi:NAD(P)-dependent dehydrogenase (short-subunit alcohol dehydrogenase family)